MAFANVFTRTAQGNALIYGNIVADFRRFAYNYACAVVYEYSVAYGCARVNFYSRYASCALRKKSCEQTEFALM
jgi:hypothetical protein